MSRFHVVSRLFCGVFVMSALACTAPAPAVADELPSSSPDPEAPVQHAQVRIDWDQPTGPITAMHWGMNDYESVHGRADRPEFQAFLAEVNSGLIRLHHRHITDKWTDAETRSWNLERIGQAFAESTGYGDAKIMLNIAHWPAWLHDGSPLPPEKHDAFIALVVELVEAVRADPTLRVDYWEVTNENEGPYEKRDRMDELYRLTGRLAQAIHAADPRAKVGGPAMTWPKPAWRKSFFEHAAPHMDFVTWHNYATGQPTVSNQEVLSKPDVIAGHAEAMLRDIAQHMPGRDVESFLTEFNIQWTWEPLERRHGNNIGAVFQAMIVKRMAELGVTGATVWHAKGNAYGLIDGQNRVRLTGELYRRANPALVGTMVRSTSSLPSALEVLAVDRGEAGRSVLLINPSPGTVVVEGSLDADAGAPGSGTRVEIGSQGVAEGAWSGAESLEVPGYSVTVIFWN